MIKLLIVSFMEEMISRGAQYVIIIFIIQFITAICLCFHWPRPQEEVEEEQEREGEAEEEPIDVNIDPSFIPVYEMYFIISPDGPSWVESTDEEELRRLNIRRVRLIPNEARQELDR